MARYRNSQDLGVFIGAKYIELPNGEGKPAIPGIFIPAGINGIDVRQDTRDESKRNASGIRAFINTQQRSCSMKYIEAVKQGLMRKGENITLYNVPAYQICYMLPEEKRTKIRAALAKRILAEHPEWSQQTDTQGTDLSRAISMMLPFQMGDSYLVEEQNQQGAYTNTSAPVAQGITGYSAATPPEDNSAQWSPANDDDLPF